MLLSGILIFIIGSENADYFTDVHAVRRFCLIIGAGSVLDRLLGTDRVDHYTTHVPQWEPRYRSEEIHQLPPGVCLVQAGGLEGYLSI